MEKRGEKGSFVRPRFWKLPQSLISISIYDCRLLTTSLWRLTTWWRRDGQGCVVVTYSAGNAETTGAGALADVRRPFYAMITSFIARRQLAPAAAAAVVWSWRVLRDAWRIGLNCCVRCLRGHVSVCVCHLLARSTGSLNVRISCREQYLTSIRRTVFDRVTED